jgi:hypothetical protein
MTTAGTAAARISHDNHKVTLIQVVGLRVAWTMRIGLFQRYCQPICPAELDIAPIARGSEQHRQPLTCLVVLRKPDINGNLYAVAHRDIQSRVAPDS